MMRSWKFTSLVSFYPPPLPYGSPKSDSALVRTRWNCGRSTKPYAFYYKSFGPCTGSRLTRYQTVALLEYDDSKDNAYVCIAELESQGFDTVVSKVNVRFITVNFYGIGIKFFGTKSVPRRSHHDHDETDRFLSFSVTRRFGSAGHADAASVTKLRLYNRCVNVSTD